MDYAKTTAQIKDLQEKQKMIKEKVLDGTDGGNMENDVLTVRYIAKKGAYDMEKICKKYNIDPEKLDDCRKGSIYYPTIKLKS
jgi:hypothetical protein